MKFSQPSTTHVVSSSYQVDAYTLSCYSQIGHETQLLNLLLSGGDFLFNNTGSLTNPVRLRNTLAAPVLR